MSAASLWRATVRVTFFARPSPQRAQAARRRLTRNVSSRQKMRDWLFAEERLNFVSMHEPLTNSQIRKFKVAAQFMEPMLKVGKAGLSEGFIRTVAETLAQHELVKIKFADFKDQKKELAPQLAEKTGSHLVMRVGNVMVLHRPRPVTEEPAGEEFPRAAPPAPAQEVKNFNPPKKNAPPFLRGLPRRGPGALRFSPRQFLPQI